MLTIAYFIYILVSALFAVSLAYRMEAEEMEARNSAKLESITSAETFTAPVISGIGAYGPFFATLARLERKAEAWTIDRPLWQYRGLALNI